METDLLVSLVGRNARLAHAVQKKCTSSRDFFLKMYYDYPHHCHNHIAKIIFKKYYNHFF